MSRQMMVKHKHQKKNLTRRSKILVNGGSESYQCGWMEWSIFEVCLLGWSVCWLLWSSNGRQLQSIDAETNTASYPN